MRECYEESGIPLTQKHIPGTLPALAMLASGNVVTPVLAWLEEAHQDQLPQDWQEDEIQSSPWVTRSYLAGPARRTTVLQGEEWAGPGFPLANGCVWGFTANVLDWLLRELEWDQPWDKSHRHTLAGE
ncbi:hypothetical protein QFZ79_004101 [Arthrobacter sp. V4I6]|nr:hypothetical protein [Arthrobacter sp. V1I7]MDQ0855990.1 hypothetical protein [Arthrobacter sp. V4I6]